MPAGTLTALAASSTGTDWGNGTAPTATYGDKIANHGQESVVVENNSADPITVTTKLDKTFDPSGFNTAITNPTTTVAAGHKKEFGPWPTTLNDGSGNITIVCSATADVLLYPRSQRALP